MNSNPLPDAKAIAENVRMALAEDLGPGDLTASLIPPQHPFKAKVVLKQGAVVCGQAWFDECFRQIDPAVSIRWQLADGDRGQNGTVVCELDGSARAILSGERSALNFLQLLSAVATHASRLTEAVEGTGVRILDTRKTIPGLRLAQKYAVRCGGAHNHRIGLYDAILIKENHIAAAGSISNAVRQARAATETLDPQCLIEVEVEDLEQLAEAVECGAQRVMLDNFSPAQAAAASNAYRDRIELEISGGITEENLMQYAAAGVDFISVGSLTKDIQAVDYSMRFR